jgi:hypothetical protein
MPAKKKKAKKPVKFALKDLGAPRDPKGGIMSSSMGLSRSVRSYTRI